MLRDTGSQTLSVEETAQVLGIGRALAYDLARQGKLPGMLRLGRRIRVSSRILDAYLNGGAENEDPPEQGAGLQSESISNDLEEEDSHVSDYQSPGAFASDGREGE